LRHICLSHPLFQDDRGLALKKALCEAGSDQFLAGERAGEGKGLRRVGKDEAGLYRPVVAVARPEDFGQDRGCCAKGNGV